MKMAAFFQQSWEIDRRTFDFLFKFDLGCAEDIMIGLPKNYYDLVFTSPPYFDVEKYSYSPDQSFMRYGTYEVWRSKFLRDIMRDAVRACKEGGHIILNVKNYEHMKIADDVLNFASQIGLDLIKTYQMRLANSEYNRKESKFHTEPIFVFRRY